MLIQRELLNILRKHDYSDGKAVVIFGARRVGKTTILRNIVGDEDCTWIDGDAEGEAALFRFSTTADARTFLHRTPNIVIDEAQHIPDFGRMLKILVDTNEMSDTPVRIFVTGSSALDLAGGVNESAVGRFEAFHLWPISLAELGETKGTVNALKNIPQHLVFGMLPNIITKPETAVKTLKGFTNSILFKDIFSLVGIRKPQSFMRLVKCLADRIGSEVSYDGLARETGLSKHTVSDYIDLLEQCFVIRQCTSFSRNVVNEIKKGKKIYFCDLGIRNAILDRFAPLDMRPDVGALWENYFYMERVKWLEERRPGSNLWFWRTKQPQGQEIDFVEEYMGERTTFECKFKDGTKAKMPAAFAEAYGTCPFHVVTPGTVWPFVSGEGKGGMVWRKGNESPFR